MSFLELAIGGAFVLRIIVDDRLIAVGEIVEGGGEGVPLCSWRGFFCEEGDIPLARVVAIVTFYEAMEVANLAQRIDLDIEEQFKRSRNEAYRGAQIRLRWRC